ncbi:MMPL family transporter [Cellulomonas endophytica]|uniref:MMPL family transporter n=1 Tax=Cellulomonas endophytica TaxID=2494735 RepID=UPI001013673B|nr:MMPL family transporter [Cellulomonas endophytica]
MTGVFARLGRLVGRHPRSTVVVWAVVTVACYALAVLGVHGQDLFDRLATGAPGVPGTESAEGEAVLAAEAPGASSLTLVVQDVPPTTAGVAEALAPVREDLAGVDGVASVIDPFVLPGGATSPAAAPLLAQDGDGFLVVVELLPDLAEDARERALGAVAERLRAVPAALGDVAPGADGLVGGASLVVEEITDQVERDLRTGEAVALPVALLIMVLVFGGFLAASMPLAGALASIAGGLGALLAFTYALDVDAAVVNVVTVLALGLSIDYGLLVVSRFREELHARTAAEVPGSGRGRRRRGDPLVAAAVERTMATAGRTVAFSALTVAIAISGLLLFSPTILRAIGAAGVAVVLVAVATALTLVPALLVLSGRRLLRPGPLTRVPGVRAVLARASDVQHEEGAFSRLAARVQRHPWWVLAGSLAALVVLALPVTHLQLRISGTELLPESSVQRTFVDTVAREYPSAGAPAVTVVARTSLETASGWAGTLAGLDGVASVDPPVASGSVVVLGVRPGSTDPGGPEAADVVREVRALDPGFETWVLGQAAGQLDFTEALTDRVAAAAAVVVVATLALLFLMTGSVVVPVKALLTNLLSIAASLGVLVWVFQDGNGSGLLGFTSTGGIETYVLALVVSFAFGLAMDYEVFLLSRIKEAHDEGRPTDEAVRRGLQRSGRIITSAAAIIVVVFAGFVAGQLVVIKQVGFALAVAVVVDATLVRLLLVPATMTLLDRWNWWAPRPLARLHARLGLTD